MLAGVGKSTENVEVTEAGTYLSFFTEPSKNSMHEGISPKGCICEGILEFYPSSWESLKMGDFNTTAVEYPNIVLGRKTFTP